jgi:hypothetical protein
MFTLKITKRPPTAAKIVKQIRFGVAKGLTETAKEGQKASIGAIKGSFTTRGTWYLPSNRYGIRIKAAKPTDLSAEVRTNADWLIPHEEGKDKRAKDGRVAVPTDQVRRNKRLIIPRGQRPKGLGAKVFEMQTKRGKVLAQRLKRGPRKGLVILYGLESRVRIERQSTFFDPIKKVVSRRLGKNIANGIRHALATAK